MRRERREPPLFFGDRLDRPVDTRKAHRQLVAEPVHRVVGTGRSDSLDAEISPLRMLGSEQATHKFGVRIYFSVVHSRHRRSLTHNNETDA